MKTNLIDHFLSKLSLEEREYLLVKLKQVVFGTIDQKVEACPCCNASKFIKKGNYKGTQRYKCLSTSKIFTSRTKTVISGITYSKLDKFTEMMDLMVMSSKFPTILELHKKLKISQQIIFDWRTKVITALYAEVNFTNEVIEFDETNCRISKKGRQGMDPKFSRVRGKKLVGDNPYNVKVFMSFSRTTKKLELFESHMGRTNTQDVENYLGVKKDVVVYSDKHQSYRKFYKKRNVLNGVFKSSNHVSLDDRSIHNQTLNYYSGSLDTFLNRELRGVSTKYLQGYLNWFMFLHNTIKREEKVSIKEIVLENKLALDIFKQKEQEFQYFLRHNGRNNYGYCRQRYVLDKAA